MLKHLTCTQKINQSVTSHFQGAKSFCSLKTTPGSGLDGLSILSISDQQENRKQSAISGGEGVHKGN